MTCSAHQYPGSFTKIVSTLGPASSSYEVISSLVDNGVDVFRINFSHGDIETHRKNVEIIRRIEKERDIYLSVLADMQGPKLRVGKFANSQGIVLRSGQHFRLDMDSRDGDEQRVCLPHREIFSVMTKGMNILINDGNIRLKVIDFGQDFADTEVLVGGPLSDHKGVNIPDVSLPLSALSDKDRVNLEAALDMGADWIGLSFVQRPEDIIEAKDIIRGRAWIVSKIEKPAALQHLSEIIRLSDCIMVARGDLGVEMPVEMVPVLQKRIVHDCRKAGKPVIVATQMLESMINNPVPTRAETSDVATAVFDGADAVMLSGETAVGKYPQKAVAMMSSVIQSVESIPGYVKILRTYCENDEEHLDIAGAVTSSVRYVAETLENAAAIVTYTETGATSLRAAKQRSCLPILSITPDISVARRMSLVWGVISRKADRPLKSFEDIGFQAERYAIETKLAKKGDNLIITAGVPFSKQGSTNTLHVISVKKQSASE